MFVAFFCEIFAQLNKNAVPYATLPFWHGFESRVTKIFTFLVAKTARKYCFPAEFLFWDFGFPLILGVTWVQKSAYTTELILMTFPTLLVEIKGSVHVQYFLVNQKFRPLWSKKYKKFKIRTFDCLDLDFRTSQRGSFPSIKLAMCF